MASTGASPRERTRPFRGSRHALAAHTLCPPLPVGTRCADRCPERPGAEHPRRRAPPVPSTVAPSTVAPSTTAPSTAVLVQPAWHPPRCRPLGRRVFREGLPGRRLVILNGDGGSGRLYGAHLRPIDAGWTSKGGIPGSQAPLSWRGEPHCGRLLFPRRASGRSRNTAGPSMGLGHRADPRA